MTFCSSDSTYALVYIKSVAQRSKGWGVGLSIACQYSFYTQRKRYTACDQISCLLEFVINNEWPRDSADIKNIKLVIYTLYLCTFHNSQWTSNDSLVRYSYKAQWIYRTKCMESLISCVNSICSLINYWSFDVRTPALSCTEIFIHSITTI